MAPRTEEQFEEIRVNKKALIMDAAMDLFANEGYHPSSISKIAKKAGISKGLLYNYFDSKEDLLVQIMTAGLKKMLSVFDPNNDGVLSEEEMVLIVILKRLLHSYIKLMNFISDIFDMLKENQAYWKLYYAVFLQPTVHILLKDDYEEMLGKFMHMLIAYYTTHGVKNPEKEAMIFGSLMDGIAFNYIVNPNLFPIESLIETVIEKFCYLNKVQ